MLGIKSLASTAYHPQTDGQTECINQEVEQYLRLFCNERQDDWAELLAMAELCYNNRVNASTQQTPFMLATGQHPRMGFEPRRAGKVEAAGEFATRMQEALAEARSALQKAADDMARFYNAHRDGSVEYAVGDKVWLDATNIKLSGTRKLRPRRLGPYTVKRKIGDLNYELDFKGKLQIHPVVHVALLTKAPRDTIPGQKPPPAPPIEVEGQEEFEVEQILDSRLFRGNLQYLVKWKDYGEEENSWEPATNVTHAQELVNEFHRRHPNAPQRIRAAIFKDLPWQPWVNFTIPNKIAVLKQRL